MNATLAKLIVGATHGRRWFPIKSCDGESSPERSSLHRKLPAIRVNARKILGILLNPGSSNETRTISLSTYSNLRGIPLLIRYQGDGFCHRAKLWEQQGRDQVEQRRAYFGRYTIALSPLPAGANAVFTFELPFRLHATDDRFVLRAVTAEPN